MGAGCLSGSTGGVPSARFNAAVSVGHPQEGRIGFIRLRGRAQIDSTGSWRRTTPAYGLRSAHLGRRVWTTNTDAPYAAVPGLSTLEASPFNQSRFSGAWLEFWYWHDFDASELAEPVRNAAGEDMGGGTVRMSLEGGAMWRVMPQESVYAVLRVPERAIRSKETAYWQVAASDGAGHRRECRKRRMF